MAAQELSGRPLAQVLRGQLKEAVASLNNQSVIPKLALVVATGDAAAHSYVAMIRRAAEKVGIETELIELAVAASQEELSTELIRLATDDAVHGIILQTPLPDSVEADALRSLIPVEKDVDGANPLSAGRLMAGLPAHTPATAAAVIALLEHYQVKLAGQRAVVVGRSRVVGKPVAHLLLAQDATVTICHSKTPDLAAITSQADVLVVAAGRAKLINKTHVKPGAVVIDVGTNVSGDNLVGDVEAASVISKAGGLSPVPGGVGPVTTALLLQHVIEAATA